MSSISTVQGPTPRTAVSRSMISVSESCFSFASGGTVPSIALAARSFSAAVLVRANPPLRSTPPRPEHTMARHGHQERVAPQRMHHGAGRPRLARKRGDLAVGGGAARRKCARRLVDGPLKISQQREIERQPRQILRRAVEVLL